MYKKRTNIILRVGLGLTILGVLTFASAPVFAKSFSQLAAEIKRKPKGASALVAARELAKLTPSNREEVYLVLELIQEQEDTAREKLINSVSNISDLKLGPIFLKELNHSHPMVRAVAAGMCGKLKIVAAEKPLIQLIRRSPEIKEFPDTDEERAAVTACLALGELGQDSSIDFLISVLGTMKGYDVQALRKFGIKPMARLLAKINDSDASSNAKMAAVQVLMALEDKAALPMLRQEAAKLDSKARPYAITIALKLDPEKALPEFIAEWKKKPDPMLETRLLFFINNWRLGDAGLTEFLIKILETSAYPSSRRMAVVSLARIKNDASLAALKQAAKDKDKTVSLYANQALEMRVSDAPQK